ncbi:MAG TPA: membrane protein insertion efficiency factor YidD [Candidatus Latescibacteria bacterium]|nr:membrane protein insertion efficiency factor YidD [Gemmatimonadota bacterium]HCR16818.1 membrane protein insertion efficiency factor YidD [Candidatus Latescibacterota bacterium]
MFSPWSSRPVKFLAISLIHAYRVVVSPYLLPRCRYQPTCSDYALQAIQKLGFLRGSYYVLFRILRCHPWGGSGYDPVPTSKDSP